jgi:hypothetical protein
MTKSKIINNSTIHIDTIPFLGSAEKTNRIKMKKVVLAYSGGLDTSYALSI